MLPQHRTELANIIAALHDSDIARAQRATLHLAAHLARDSADDATLSGQAAEEAEQDRARKQADYRHRRLEIATAILAGHKYWEDHVAIEAADRLMAANASAPIPDGAIP